MNRYFSDYVTEVGKKNLLLLIDKETDSNTYSHALYELGLELGSILSKKVSDRERNICVACSVEDADFLAKGMIESLTFASFNVSLACFWNQREKLRGVSIAPIMRKYREPNVNEAKTIFILKTVISGACVIKTNLTHLIQILQPNDVFVIAPVIHEDAPSKLSQEFPKEIRDKFKYIYFAKDTERRENGELIPGVGGNVYERLGFKNQIDKNKITPKIIRERRNLLMTNSV